MTPQVMLSSVRQCCLIILLIRVFESPNQPDHSNAVEAYGFLGGIFSPTSSQLPPNTTTASSSSSSSIPIATNLTSSHPSPAKHHPTAKQLAPNKKSSLNPGKLYTHGHQRNHSQESGVKVVGTKLTEFNQSVLFNSDGSLELPNPNINNAGQVITDILNGFFETGYDKRVRPNYSGPPALVNVSFHIIGISSVSEVQMDFTTDFYFRQKWYDPRLEFKPIGAIDELCVGSEFADRIWLPDTFFANEKTATFHKATTENTFIRVGHNGRVYRSIRLTVTCSCPMDLQYFPMDKQKCKIEIESYGYNTRDINYRWENGNNSVSLDGKIELPQFKVLGYRMGEKVESLSSGDYIRLYCEIHFVRSMGYYLIQIYIPASLIVIISWVSFWLHRNATPARVALGVTTVLTMTTLMTTTNAALPKISYVKSIDVFLGTCFVMVFASLLEYASVGYIGKRIAMKRKRKQDLQQLQQHHQKVCLAAAASAAAAASHAQKLNPVGVAPILELKKHKQLMVTNYQGQGSQLMMTASLHANSQSDEKQRLNAGLMGAPDDPACDARSGAQKWAQINLRRHQQHQVDSLERVMMREQKMLAGHLPGSAQMLASTQKPQIINAKIESINNQVASVAQPPAEPGNPAGPTQAGQSPSGGADSKQPEEVIKICGLTPSAIDKYSRVVFPICFVCFNLMYWIIYGHISQQTEESSSSPLIPFIRS